MKNPLNSGARLFIFAAKQTDQQIKVKHYGPAAEQRYQTQTSQRLQQAPEGSREGEEDVEEENLNGFHNQKADSRESAFFRDHGLLSRKIRFGRDGK
jgi:hypothetical protein